MRALAWLLLVLASAAAAREPLAPPPAPAGWRLAGAPRLYPGRELYGHIDGGAELFHEFGFVDLLVAAYADSADRELDLEVYRLEDARAAYAVYLLKCGREAPLPALAHRHSAAPHQLTLVAGDLFIQVNNPDGAPALQPAMAAIADAAAGSRPAPGGDPLFAALPQAGLRPHSERLLRGAFSEEPYLPFSGGDPLSLDGRVYAAVGDYGEALSPERAFVAAYPDSGAARAALAALAAICRRDASLLAAAAQGLSFRDYAGRFGAARIAGDTLRLQSGLVSLPTLR
ncbi:hypothetical protein FJ251_02490 [bacterium]|nr:hypothetical protein [bacterium]